jgi:hypothetical protein
LDEPDLAVIFGADPNSASSPEPAGIVAHSIIARRRRRSRQAESRPKVVLFSLTEEEFVQVSAAAARCRMARGAFDAEVTLAAVRGAETKVVHRCWRR